MKSRTLGQNYALVAAAVVFLALLAAAVGIFLYGLTGPFAAALMQSLGVRRVLVAALVAMAAAMALSTLATTPWQLILTWGVLGGLASGCVAGALAATITNRWFIA